MNTSANFATKLISEATNQGHNVIGGALTLEEVEEEVNLNQYVRYVIRSDI